MKMLFEPGCISATSNAHPPARLHGSSTRGRMSDADTQQARLDEIRGVFQKFSIPRAQAAMRTRQRHALGTVYPPLALTAEQPKRRW